MKKSKTKWNYAVVKSIFGALWIGKTKLKANEQYIFSDIDDASNFACQLFEDAHIDFNVGLDAEDENYNDELVCQFEELEYPKEEEIEEIPKTLEKTIVKG